MDLPVFYYEMHSLLAVSTKRSITLSRNSFFLDMNTDPCELKYKKWALEGLGWDLLTSIWGFSFIKAQPSIARAGSDLIISLILLSSCHVFWESSVQAWERLCANNFTSYSIRILVKSNEEPEQPLRFNNLFEQQIIRLTSSWMSFKYINLLSYFGQLRVLFTDR